MVAVSGLYPFSEKLSHSQAGNREELNADRPPVYLHPSARAESPDTWRRYFASTFQKRIDPHDIPFPLPWSNWNLHTA